MSGLPWFRVDVDLTDHPKVHALEAIVGDAALSYVVRLWSWTMRYAARGRLADGARTALEAACRWRGKSGELVAALIITGFLDEVNGGLEVHDWWLSQGKVVEKAEKDALRKRERRADGAKTARAASADGARTARVRDETRRNDIEASVEHGSTAPLELVPTPTPKAPPTTAEARRAAEASLTDDEYQVFEHWRQTCNHPRAVATPERRRVLAKALQLYPVAELQASIDGCAASPWHRGENDRHRAYDDLELILRDARHIEGFARGTMAQEAS